MALVPLTIAPALRPWRFAGVTHLLLDEAASQRLDALREAASTARSAPAPSVLPRQEAASPVRRSDSQSAPASPSSASSSGKNLSPHESPAKRQPLSHASEPSGASSDAPTIPTIPTLSPDNWPAYWQDLLQRTPPNPTLLWTYPSLSRDLGGEADEAHRNFLRRLLGDMALPRGSHAFWPLNSFPYADGESEATVNASMFASGVNLLTPDTVVLMTGTAPPELGIDARLLSPVFVRGKRYVVTPHVDELLSASRRYTQLMIFLKALLR